MLLTCGGREDEMIRGREQERERGRVTGLDEWREGWKGGKREEG